MGSLSGVDDSTINATLDEHFALCDVMSELDASTLYILLQDMKDEAENNQSVWFDAMETP